MLGDVASDPEDTFLPWLNDVQFIFFITGTFAVVMLIWFRWIVTEQRIRETGAAMSSAADERRSETALKRTYRWWVRAQVDHSASWARFCSRIAPALLVVSAIGFVVSTVMGS